MEILHQGELNCLVGTRFYFSPTHDLILIFSGGRRMQLSPIDLNRNFFQSKLPKKVISFGWDCYGKTFTVASDDNRISVHSIELNGRSIHSFKIREPISEVFWIRSPKLSHFFDPTDIKRDLEALKKVPAHDKYLERVYDRTPLLIKKKNGIHILCVSSKQNLRFYFYSIFQFCSIRMRRFIRDVENVEILKTLVSPNFMVTSILIQHKDQLKLVVLNTRKLGLCKSSLFVVSQNFAHLSRMLLNVKKIILNIRKLWSLFFHGLFKGKLMSSYRKAFFGIEDRLFRDSERKKRREERKKRKREERERNRMRHEEAGEETVSLDEILNHSLQIPDDDEEDVVVDEDEDEDEEEEEDEGEDSDDSENEEEDDQRRRRRGSRRNDFSSEMDQSVLGFLLDDTDRSQSFRNFDETCDHMQNFFIQYILYGRLNKGLIDFLTEHLDEAFIVKMLRSFKFIRQGIVAYILKYLTHYVLHCMYRLSILQGCTKWRDKFGSLGLKEGDVDDLMKEFENMHVLSRQVMNKVNDFSKNFLTFMQYLRYLHFVEILNDEPDQKNLEFPLTQYIDDGEIKHFLLDLKHLEDIGIEELLVCYERVQKKFLPVFNPVSKSLSKSVKKMGIVSVSSFPFVPSNVPKQVLKKMNEKEEEENVIMMDEDVKTEEINEVKKKKKKKEGVVVEMKNMESYQFFGFLYRQKQIAVLKWDTCKRMKFKREIMVLHVEGGFEVKAFKFIHLRHPKAEKEETKKECGRILCLLTRKSEKQVIYALGIIDLRKMPFSPIIPKQSIDKIVRTKGPHQVKLEKFEMLKSLPQVRFDFLEIRDGNVNVYSEGGAGREAPTSCEFCIGCLYSSLTNYYIAFKLQVDEDDSMIVGPLRKVKKVKKEEGRDKRMEDEK